MDELPSEWRQRVEAIVEGSDCECGCGLTLALCALTDPLCPSWPKAVDVLGDSIGAGCDEGVVRQRLARLARTASQGRDESPWVLEDNATLPVAFRGLRWGQSEGAVTLTLVEDLASPRSRDQYLLARRLLHDHESRLRIEVYLLPDDSRPESVLAARLAIAASAQDGFWKLRDAVYGSQHRVSEEWLLMQAQALGLDASALLDAARQPFVRDHLSAARALTTKLGTVETPTLLINGRRLHGRPTAAVLGAIIHDAARARPDALNRELVDRLTEED